LLAPGAALRKLRVLRWVVQAYVAAPAYTTSAPPTRAAVTGSPWSTKPVKMTMKSRRVVSTTASVSGESKAMAANWSVCSEK